MATAILLDGKTPVNARTLVSTMLTVALLSREKAGDIRLEMDGNSLCAVPTGKETEWPSASLESRLATTHAQSVEDLVFDWIAAQSKNPWNRAYRMIKIMLLLRGIAQPGKPYRGRDAVDLAWTAEPPPSTPADAQRLLDACQQKRPEFLIAFEDAYKKAVKRRKRGTSDEHFEEQNPWLLESSSDRERFEEASRGSAPIVLPSWVAIFPAAGLWALLVRAHSFPNNRELIELVTPIWIVLLILFYLPVPALRRYAQQVREWMMKKWPQTTAVPRKATLFEHVLGIGFLSPLLALLTVAVISSPSVTIVVFAVAGYGAYRLLSTRTQAAITTKVDAPAHPLPAEAQDEHTLVDGTHDPRTSSAPDPVGPTKKAGRSADTRDLPPLPWKLEPVRPRELSPSTDTGARRITDQAQRSPAVRGMWIHAVRALALATIIITLVEWLVINHGSIDLFPWGRTILLVITVAALSRQGGSVLRGGVVAGILRALSKGNVSLSNAGIPASSTIRPIALPLLGALWVLTGLLQAPAILKRSPDTFGTILFWTAIAIPLVYLAWIWRVRRVLENRYPYHPPLNLLGLRVFGSDHLQDFLDLTNAWQWLGIRQRLDGPGTTGRKARDVVNYLRGHVNDSIVENREELEMELAQFRSRCDGQLRFPLNSIQCNNATWKSALERLLDRADVVVMDLSSLTPENRGVAHELGRLIDRFPLDRVVLLVQEFSDLDTLDDILRKAWHKMPNSSPNKLRGAAPLLIDIGGLAAQQASESYYEWQHRMHERMGEEQLVATLYDIARPALSQAPAETLADVRAIRWTRTNLPAVVRTLIVAGFAILLYSVVQTGL